ncbi:MAG: error-prone DNA polymerase [Pseudomonadota bacterium]
MDTALPAYAELHALSNFSFQRGASRPEELVARAHELGYTAIAITDECSVAGVVRAHRVAKRLELQLLPGAEFRVQAAAPFTLVVLPHNLSGWGNLCAFITAARSDAKSAGYEVVWERTDFSQLTDCEVLLAPQRQPGSAIDTEALQRHLVMACSLLCSQLWLAVELLGHLDDALHLQQLEALSAATGVPLVAAGNVLMHARSRKPLQDVLTAIALGQPVQDCGFALQPNAEAHLRLRARLATVYDAHLLQATLTVAARCSFSLDQIRYQYPLETVAEGSTPAQTLADLTWQGAAERFPKGVPENVRTQIASELALISEKKYEMYFLTVHDLVRHARSLKILCQGRGSAANSAVCFCLGVTAVNPAEQNLLFERFLSRERDEPPDIDIDFEHERREEVIQYIYKKYGRDRAAIAATVISYRSRSALRDTGKALGIAPALVDRFAKEHFWFDGPEVLRERLQTLGVNPDDGHVLQWLDMARQLMGDWRLGLSAFPRHLSQHVGGFVLTQGKLTRLVPVQNAAMKDRSIIQWDKDDLDTVGLLKVDVLALGMLSAIRRCLDFVNTWRGTAYQLHTIPRECEATYDMICEADTVGVFQIESRAQMSMLPRLRPRRFYDLVVEVAIVRPGPIKGGMVHPFLKARERQRKNLSIHYEKPELKAALERTLGVPIFQEQVMQIAMIAALFSADQADTLRRSMAAWKHTGGVHHFERPLVDGMVGNGYRREFAEAIFQQILGFGEYGFPESHAASFAILVYASCWLKKHEPACFLAALLNAQPMGFYGPSQLVQDAKRHGVVVRPVDVLTSDWDCTLEADAASANPAVRLGLRLVSGLGKNVAQRIVQARHEAPAHSIEDLALRAQLDTRDINALAAADALASLAGHRRQQVWQAAALKPAPVLLKQVPTHEAELLLPPAPEGEDILFDYRSTGLTLRRHPLALLRPRLARRGLLTAAELRDLPSGQQVRACGIVTVRQQPQSANGTIFVSIEDETGAVNVIVWKTLRESQRSEVLHARLLAVSGLWQRDTDSGGQVRHLVAQRLLDLTHLLGRLGTSSRDFH